MKTVGSWIFDQFKSCEQQWTRYHFLGVCFILAPKHCVPVQTSAKLSSLAQKISMSSSWKEGVHASEACEWNLCLCFVQQPWESTYPSKNLQRFASCAQKQRVPLLTSTHQFCVLLSTWNLKRDINLITAGKNAIQPKEQNKTKWETTPTYLFAKISWCWVEALYFNDQFWWPR